MGRVAAVDPGEKRTGLAVSDEMKFIARPLSCVDSTGLKATVQRISEALKEFEIDELLVGNPLHMKGRAGDAANRSQALAGELIKMGFRVRLVDERLSTVEAGRKLHQAGLSARDQRSKIDSAAAAVLLQSYLDSQGGEYGM